MEDVPEERQTLTGRWPSAPTSRCGQDRSTDARSRPLERSANCLGYWIAQTMVPRFQAIGYFGGSMFYGYQWWQGRTLSDGTDVKWIAAMGLGGQRIIVVPDHDLVVMTTSGLYTSPRQGNGTLEILYRFVIPAVRGKGK